MKTEKSTATLNILLLHDGKPGHFNQSDGIVAALARRRSVIVERLEVGDGGLLPARAVRALTAAGSYPQAMMERLSGTSQLEPMGKPDVIISAGGKTIVANIMLTRRYKGANIFSGSLRGVPPSSFSAVLHINPKLENQPPYIVGLKPSAIEVPARTRIAGVMGKFALLMGGPTKTHLFTPEQFDVLLSSLKNSRLDWEIVTSRRTPTDWADALIGIANEAHIHLHDYRKTGPGGVKQVLASVDGAVITDDSVSMISEAIAARLPVVSLTADTTGQLSDQDYLDLLQARKWYCPLPMHDFSDDTLTDAARQCAPMEENHVDLLAEKLFAQIPRLVG